MENIHKNLNGFRKCPKHSSFGTFVLILFKTRQGIEEIEHMGDSELKDIINLLETLLTFFNYYVVPIAKILSITFVGSKFEKIQKLFVNKKNIAMICKGLKKLLGKIIEWAYEKQREASEKEMDQINKNIGSFFRRFLKDLSENKIPIAIGVILGGAAAPVAITAIIAAIGFTSAGIASGSLAAGMMAASGGVVASGSAVAVLQSIGAVGLSTVATGGVALAGAAVAVAVTGGVFAVRALIKKKPPKCTCHLGENYTEEDLESVSYTHLTLPTT
eukprot:TRINITY_DN3594_c0_g1_i1.p1 TRINITY_DN3594_c0_g1~~TRINITY_DN3594_c0_g1_i1.p1  ORF type:complete len:274 (-),score=65.00 TRINITY_DN3594_c0_g1_i1:21-842(-)